MSTTFALSFWCAHTDIANYATATSGVLLGPPHPQPAFMDTNKLVPVPGFSGVIENPGTTVAGIYPDAGSNGAPTALVAAVTSEDTSFGLVTGVGPLFALHVKQDFEPTLTPTPTLVAGAPSWFAPPERFYWLNDASQAYTGTDANKGTMIWNNDTSAFINTGSLSLLHITGETFIAPTDPLGLNGGNPWTTLSGFPTTTWVHIMMSFDSSSQRFVMYANDTLILDETVAQEDQVTVDGGTSSISMPDQWDFPFTASDYVDADGLKQAWNICGRFVGPQARGYSTLPDGSGDDPTQTGLQTNLCELWFAKNQFVDWAVSGNRDKFHVRDAGSTIWAPCSLGADGSLPTGTVPTVYCSGGPASFPRNLAAGTELTVTGTVLTSAVTPPT